MTSTTVDSTSTAAGAASGAGEGDAAGASYDGVRSRFPAGSITLEAPDPRLGEANQPTWIVRREVLADLARELRDNRETRFDLLMDLAGVDYPDPTFTRCRATRACGSRCGCRRAIRCCLP